MKVLHPRQHTYVVPTLADHRMFGSTLAFSVYSWANVIYPIIISTLSVPIFLLSGQRNFEDILTLCQRWDTVLTHCVPRAQVCEVSSRPYLFAYCLNIYHTMHFVRFCHCRKCRNATFKLSGRNRTLWVRVLFHNSDFLF